MYHSCLVSFLSLLYYYNFLFLLVKIKREAVWLNCWISYRLQPQCSVNSLCFPVAESLQVCTSIESQACGFCSWLHLFTGLSHLPGCLEVIHPRKAWEKVGRCGLALEPLLASNSYKRNFEKKKKKLLAPFKFLLLLCWIKWLSCYFGCRDVELQMKMMNRCAETRKLSTSLCCNVAVHKQFPPKLWQIFSIQVNKWQHLESRRMMDYFWRSNEPNSVTVTVSHLVLIYPPSMTDLAFVYKSIVSLKIWISHINPESKCVSKVNSDISLNVVWENKMNHS